VISLSTDSTERSRQPKFSLLQVFRRSQEIGSYSELVVLGFVMGRMVSWNDRRKERDMDLLVGSKSANDPVTGDPASLVEENGSKRVLMSRGGDRPCPWVEIVVSEINRRSTCITGYKSALR